MLKMYLWMSCSFWAPMYLAINTHYMCNFKRPRIISCEAQGQQPTPSPCSLLSQALPSANRQGLLFGGKWGVLWREDSVWWWRAEQRGLGAPRGGGTWGSEGGPCMPCACLLERGSCKTLWAADCPVTARHFPWQFLFLSSYFKNMVHMEGEGVLLLTAWC